MYINAEVINEALLENSFYEGTITKEQFLKDDFGIDSLRMVELIVAIEEKLSISFKESDLDPDTINTVGDLYELVDKYSL